jgi:small subunit ribosomal protein S18
MARNNDRDRDRSGSKKSTKEVVRKGGKKKVCIFCVKQIKSIGYKDVDILRKYMSDRGKIRARRVSGNCSQHQRAVAIAIKTARELALLPYTQRTVAERSGGGRGAAGRTAVPSEPETVFMPAEDLEELEAADELYPETDEAEEAK